MSGIKEFFKNFTLFLLGIFLISVGISFGDSILLGNFDVHKFDLAAVASTKFWCFEKNFAPLNFIRQNLNFSSLAYVSLHPWYTHALVNAPILFGPLVFLGYFFVSQCVWVAGRIDQINPKYWLFLSSFAVPLFCLSMYPHQNVKDLCPLLVPLVLLACIRVL